MSSIQRVSSSGGNWVVGVKVEDIVRNVLYTYIVENVFLLIWGNGGRLVIGVSWAINIAGDIWEDR